jgi:hypothetical protein
MMKVMGAFWNCMNVPENWINGSGLKVRDMSFPFIQNILQGKSAHIFQKSISCLKNSRY